MKPNESQVPLHYNIYFGINLIGEWHKIFYLPALGIIIFLMNFFIAFFLYQRQKILSQLISGSTLFFELLLFWAGLLVSFQII